MRDINWQMSLDNYLKNPPEYPESKFKCDGKGCRWVFMPDDKVFEIEGLNLCRECAQRWLEERGRWVTERECYGDE